MHILHVDDNLDDLELIKIQLLRHDPQLQIHWAESAEKANEVLKKQEIDCVICDYQMPKINGLQFLRSLRRRKFGKPFIFLTGQGSEEVAADAMRAGADAYYTKETGLAHYHRMLITIRKVVEAYHHKQEKQEAIKALRLSEERYRRIVETAEEGIWSIDRRGITTFVNSRMAELLGYVVDEMLGRSVFRYIDDEWKQEVLKRFGDGRGLAKSQFEFKFRRKDGGEIWGLVTANPILDDSGRFQAGLAMITDITDRKRSLDALRESEERFRTVFLTSPDAVNIHRLEDGLFVDVNEAFTSITGYRAEEVIGKTSLEIDMWYDPADRENLVKLLERDGYVKNMEAKFRLKDGRVRIGLLSARIINLNSVPHILAVTRDIHDIKPAEESLRESEAKFRSLFESSKDMVFITTTDGRFKDVNNSGCELTGYSKDELLATNVETLYADSGDRRAFRSNIETRGFVKEYPLLLVRKDGEKVNVLITASLQKNRQGEITGYQGIIRDVTVRTKAERELKNQEEKYRNLFNYSNDMIILHDLAGNIIDVNNQGLAKLGYSLDEILALKISDLHPAESSAASKRAFDAIKSHGKVIFDILFKKKSGEFFEAEVSSSMFEVRGARLIQGIVRDVTDRKRVDEALRKSEEKFARVFHSSPNAITITRINDGCYLDVNMSFEKLSGYEKSEVIGRSISDVGIWMDNSDRDRFIQALKSAGEVDNFESDFRIKDGSELVGLVFATVMEIDGEECIVAETMDITDRKRNEEALRRERDLIRMIYEMSPAGITVVDKDGKISFANRRAEQILGLKKDEITQRTYNDPEWRITGFDGNYFPDEELPFVRVMKSGKPVFVIRHAILWPNGRRVLLSINAAPLVDKSGELAGMVAVVDDITDLHLASEALRAGEERYRTFIDQSNEGIWRMEYEESIPINLPEEQLIEKIRENAVIAECNDALAKMYGYSRAGELVGTKPKDMLKTPESVQANTEGIRAFIRSGFRVENVETLETDKDGNIRYFLNNAVGIIKNGHLVGEWGIQRDITEQKRSADQLRRSRDQLAAANQELEAFGYSVSHDLREPLRGIAGFTKILLSDHSGKLDDKGCEYLQRVAAGAERMNQLISDILKLSRLSKAELSLEKIDLSAMAASISKELKSSEPDRDIEVSIMNDLVIEGDSRLTQLLLSNLIGNAWKFLGKKKNGKIEVGCLQREGKPIFFVRDNGPGFDTMQAEKIFLPFQRLHKDREYEGSGIGLAIVKRVVQRHGGKVWAESEKGKGAAFYFTYDA
jgi:PAS domain S-box-containing protein